MPQGKIKISAVGWRQPLISTSCLFPDAPRGIRAGHTKHTYSHNPGQTGVHTPPPKHTLSKPASQGTRTRQRGAPTLLRDTHLALHRQACTHTHTELSQLSYSRLQDGYQQGHTLSLTPPPTPPPRPHSEGSGRPRPVLGSRDRKPWERKRRRGGGPGAEGSAETEGRRGAWEGRAKARRLGPWAEIRALTPTPQNQQVQHTQSATTEYARILQLANR